VWHAPAAARRCLIIATPTTVRTAANRHPAVRITMSVANPIPADARLAVGSKTKKPTTSSAAIVESLGT
jgi:hypothetical protein